MKLKSFSAFGARLWNCLHHDWRKLTKGAFKRKLHKLLLAVLGIEDYYVDAHYQLLKFNTCPIIIVPYTYVVRYILRLQRNIIILYCTNIVAIL